MTSKTPWERKCNDCGLPKAIGDFEHENGRKCKECYKQSNREKHARYRAENRNGYNQKVNARTARWRKTTKGRATRNAYQNEYRKTPIGRANVLECLHRFVERHPLYNLEYLERMIRIAEGFYELDRAIYDDGAVTYKDRVTYEDVDREE